MDLGVGFKNTHLLSGHMCVHTGSRYRTRLDGGQADPEAAGAFVVKV
jgi:hypothetical protein